ncbi:MAG: tetratricopeptide repeat protein, partial [Planctomycetota bacterium]|nr:tetratricopeptide repeat protein [Planctomycetota bacterium]
LLTMTNDFEPTRPDFSGPPLPRGGEVPNSGALDIGRYQNIQPLARGGIGQVLSAYDPYLDRTVAIKILHPDRKSAHAQIVRFRQEARISGGLDHPTIVTIHDMGQLPDGAYYFIMKLVSGESLGQILRNIHQNVRQRGVSHDGTPLLGTFQKVCDAIAFAHAHGVVHRDLKPDNLMRGAYGEVLVMDWGIAKKIDAPGFSQSDAPTDSEPQAQIPSSIDPLQTLDGAVVGTPSYMSPEQAEGRIEDIGPRSDIYCLGIILYQILALDPPFSGSHPAQILFRIAAGKFLPPSRRSPTAHIPRELEAVVLKAMAREPHNRYQSVPELQEDIQAYLDGRTLGALTYGPLQRLSKWIARNRKTFTGAAAEFLLAVMFFGILLWQQKNDRDREKEQARRELNQTFNTEQNLARQLLKEAGDLTDLTADQIFVDPRTGAQKRESPEKRIVREQAIQAHLTAARHLEKALQIHPGDPSVLRLRVEAGKTLATLALVGRDYLLARSAYERLLDFGLPPNELNRFVNRIEETRSARLSWRSKRLRTILDEIAELGADDRPEGRPLLPDYVFEAVSYRDVQTVKILVVNLDELTEKAKREGESVVWTQAERDRATFICRVLGRLGLSECVEPMGRWMAVVIDHDLVREAGLALCNTRLPEAQPHLLTARDRIGVNSNLWRSIRQFMHRIPESKSSQPPSTAPDFLQQGLLYLEKRMHEKAIIAYTQAIQLNPRFAQAYVNRGNVHFHKENLDSALQDYSRAIEIDPKNANAFQNRSNVRMKLGHFNRALEDSNKAIQIDPRFVSAYLVRGAIHANMGNTQKAVENFSTAIEIDPRCVNAYKNRGLLRFNKGDLRGATEDYERAIEFDPKFAQAYFELGNIRMAKRDRQGAIENYTQTIEIDPNFAMAYHNRGMARKQMGDLQNAISDFSQAIEIDPDLALAYSNRGYVRGPTGDIEGAITDFTKAIELDPNFTDAYHGRGIAHANKRDFESAVTDLSKTIELDPNRPGTYFTRGKIRLNLQDLRGAMADYEKALEVAPKNWGLRKRAEDLLAQTRKKLSGK